MRAMVPGRLRALGLAAMALLALVAVMVVDDVGTPAGAASNEVAADGCTTEPPSTTALKPSELADRYGVAPLHAAGYDGTGVTIAVLEFHQRADLDLLEQWERCLHRPIAAVTQTVVDGSTLPAGDEAQGDVEVVAGMAPGADIHVFATDQDMHSNLGDLVDHVLDPANTGGEAVDVITLSYGDCEAGWSPTERESVETALGQARQAGVWFFASAGDAGSSDCVTKGTCPTVPPTPAVAAVGYPASSPQVISVGGTQFEGGDPRGAARVWKHEGSSCGAGGGGTSSSFERPAYQDTVQSVTGGSRGVPDLAALAGEPEYLLVDAAGAWISDGGTSLAAPLYAGAMASLRSKLAADGVAPPADLSATLYRLASDPSAYAEVFADVTVGDNDLMGVGCCSATTGYDLASGLGELHADAFAAWLIAQAPPSTTTTTSVAPSSTATTGVVPSGDVVRPAFTG